MVLQYFHSKNNINKQNKNEWKEKADLQIYMCWIERNQGIYREKSTKKIVMQSLNEMFVELHEQTMIESLMADGEHLNSIFEREVAECLYFFTEWSKA